MLKSFNIFRLFRNSRLLTPLPFILKTDNFIRISDAVYGEQKEKVLIIGSSGSGKSTLLKLIYKYYDINRDKIYLNNYDINDYSLQDIRENITYISQNEVLYNDTIRNNIILTGKEIINSKITIYIRKLKYTKIGNLTAIYFIWYGIIRFFIEGLRQDSLMFFNLKIAQLISILMVLIGIYLLIIPYIKRLKKKS